MADNSKDDQNPILRELTVRQIADRARKAARMGTRPPKDIEAAFKMVIVNRSRLNKHYELLFPKLERSKENAKNIPKDLPNFSSKSCTNSFEALAELIEVEEEFDVPAYELWRDGATTPGAKSFAIKEDSIGNIVALQAWLTESQAIIEITKSIWASFATGDLTLSAAGWLTNMAQHYVRIMDDPNTFDYSKASFWCTGNKKDVTVRPGVTSEELGTAEFSKIATNSLFAELTHGCGLCWPFYPLRPFLETKQLPDLPEERPRRFENYFLSASEERVAKESFAQSVTQWVACNSSELIPGLKEYPDRDNKKETYTICDNRYRHDRILLASLVKGASQHPLYKGYKSEHASFEWGSKYIERALTVPLLCELKEEGICVKIIVAAHMLLKSGRSFVHELEKIGKPPLNCRIPVLRRANEVLNAIEDLIRGRTFHERTADLMLILRNKLRVFVSEKTFDIYSQSPWVAGSQISGISDLSLFIGLEILGERDCFGAVIHLYNMLQQILVEYTEIPILEHLKTLFRSKVFVCNQEPRRNFGNTFQLFCGDAKIHKYPDVNIRVIAEDRRRKPSHKRAKCSKFPLERMSLVAHESLFGSWGFSPEFMDRLAVDPKVHRRCAETRPEELFDSYPPLGLVQRARKVLRSEYDGALALTRLNCFAVLRLCQDILFGIAARFKALGTAAWPPRMDRRWESQEIEGAEIEWAIDCVYLTMRLVDYRWDGGIDGSLKNRFSLKQNKDAMLCLTPVVVMRDVLAEICKGKMVEDFLWKNV
ncbi:unnamed protein product [Alternaria alternata]